MTNFEQRWARQGKVPQAGLHISPLQACSCELASGSTTVCCDVAALSQRLSVVPTTRASRTPSATSPLNSQALLDLRQLPGFIFGGFMGRDDGNPAAMVTRPGDPELWRCQVLCGQRP